MSYDLTDRQEAVLNYIRGHITSEGLPPTLREIATAFGLASLNGVAKHLEALETKGAIRTTHDRKRRGIEIVGQRRLDTLSLPVVGRVAAGEPMFSDAFVEREVNIERALFKPMPAYLLRVSGQSMIDAGILDGDLIGVHPTPTADHGQIVVARLGEEAITVKRLQKRGRGVRLISCNPEFAPIDPDPTEDFAIEGLYCGLIRTL